MALSSLELRTLPYRCFETLTKVRADIPQAVSRGWWKWAEVA